MVPMPLGCRPWLLLTQMPLWWTYTLFMEDVSMWSVMLAVHKWLPKCGPSAIMLPWWVQEFHVSRVLNWVIVKGGRTLVLCPSPTSSEQHCFCVSKFWYWNALSQHAVIRLSHNTLIGLWNCLALWRRTSTLSWCRNKHRLMGSSGSSPTISLNRCRISRPKCKLSLHNFTARSRLRTRANRLC